MKKYFFSSRSIVYASLLLLLFSLAVSSAYAQEIEFEKTWGGEDMDGAYGVASSSVYVVGVVSSPAPRTLNDVSGVETTPSGTETTPDGVETTPSGEPGPGYRDAFLISLVTVSVVSTDETGEGKDVFDIPETVYVRGSGYSPTTSHDLYLVEDTTWSDGMDIPDRVSGTETSVTTDEKGDIPAGTVAWNGQLTPGKYDIVIDVNSNGVYDEDIDALDDEDIEVTAGLFVVPEVGTILILIGCFAAFIVFSISKSKHWHL